MKESFNAKEHPQEQIGQIASSISEFGFNDPIAIDDKNVIIEGHGRLLAAQKLGLKQVPVIRLSHLSNYQKKAYIIAHNKLTMNTGFDADLLQIEMDFLKDASFDLEMMGFDENEILDFMNDVESEGNIDDDEIPEIDESEEPRIKLGDSIELGEHRVLCGDSTKKEDVEKLMSGKMASMVFTDPPYDFEDNSRYCSIIDMFCENAHVFVMHDDRGLVDYLRSSKLDFRRFFVADFTFSSPRGNDPYLRHILLSHEAAGNPISHQNMHDGFGSIVKMKYRGFLKSDTEHNHEKSVDFITKFIEHYSLLNNIVLDIFLGSGSTLIACEKTKRKCYGMELDEHYCDVIIQRYCEFTDNYNIKINGKEVDWRNYN